MAWSDSEHDEVLKALAVACEVTGTNLSMPAKMFMLGELGTYTAKEAIAGLSRAARDCKGRMSLADVVRGIEFVDRKALSDARAARSIYLTHLRGCALVERIAWNERDAEGVRQQLEARGYRFGEAAKPVKQLPHWSETENE